MIFDSKYFIILVRFKALDVLRLVICFYFHVTSSYASSTCKTLMAILDFWL